MGYLRIEQLYSDVSTRCPACDDMQVTGDWDDRLAESSNHIISEHGWELLHVGQQTGTSGDTGEPIQRTTVILGEPEGPRPKRQPRMGNVSDLG